MLRIEITETTASVDEMAELLRQIANLIEQGYTSGNYPHWKINDETGN